MVFDGVAVFCVVLADWRLWIGGLVVAGFAISCGLLAGVLGCCFGFRLVARICLRRLFCVLGY